MSLEESKKAILPYCYPPDDEMPGLVLNMNDTWCWASAWGEGVPEDKIPELADLIWRYGNCGVLYWVSEQHDGMKSEFKDINRFVDFVRREEKFRKDEPNSSKRAYTKLKYTLGG